MIPAAAAAALAAAVAAALTALGPTARIGGWVGRLPARPLPGVVALLGLGTVAILLAALPGIASAHPTGLFVIWVIAVLVLMGVGAAGAWQVRGGSGRPGR